MTPRSAQCSDIGCAPRWALLAALLSAAWTRCAGQSEPAQCAQLIVGAVDDVVNAAYDINQAAADCTLPTLDELSCAGDLTDMMSYWFNMGNKVADLTLACGSLENACASNVLQALGDISDVSNNLVAASQDCTTDSWFCAYDIVTAVDSLNSFVGDIINALQSCNHGAIDAVDFGGVDAAWDEFLAPPAPSGDDGGYYAEWRLREAPAAAPAAAASAPPAAAWPHTGGPGAGTAERRVGDLFVRVKTDLQQLGSRIRDRKAAAAARAMAAEAARASFAQQRQQQASEVIFV